MKEKKPKATLVALVQNRPGVLERVAALIRRRGFNIHSITVGVTQNLEVSRMTLVVECEESRVEQLARQLEKLIDVLNVRDISAKERVERELLLVKVKCNRDSLEEIVRIVGASHGQAVDVASGRLTLEFTGEEAEIDERIRCLAEFGIVEISRTGITAMVSDEVSDER